MGERVEIPVAGWPGTMGGYLARPSATGRYPAVIVGFQLFGLDANVMALADRLAAAGYVALVPDLYHRVAPGTALVADDEGRRRGFELLHQLTAEGIVADLGAALDHLRGDSRVTDRVGALGLSVGGHFAYLGATALDLAATAVLYPGWLTSTELPRGAAEPTVDRTPGIAARGGRMLVLFAADDHLIPPADRELIGKALASAGVRHEIVVYPDTPHAFFFPGAPTYRPGPAADAWERVLGLFADAL